MTATDFPQRREKYLKLSRSYQFGNLASDLNRVYMGLAGTGYVESLAFWIEQAKHLAEWTAVNAKPEEVKELLEIQNELAKLQQNINDITERELMKTRAKAWSDHMIEHSELLGEQRSL
jgi:hypothetical protein